MMFNFGIGETWDAIIMYGIATEEELQLVTCINGYHDIEQFLEEV